MHLGPYRGYLASSRKALYPLSFSGKALLLSYCNILVARVYK